jgi:hypothetical protein
MFCGVRESGGLRAFSYGLLICYSRTTGIRQVALVVFVRKHLPEIQYLKTTITNEQCHQFGEAAFVSQ